jgi:predicted small lipoprotein YifL
MPVPSWFRGRAPRVLRCASGALIAVAVAALTACGKKGPPLAPLRLVPGPVADVTARRVGPDVQLRFKLPTANANGPGRIDLDHVEVYAVTVAPGSVTPPNRDLLTKIYLVGTIPVKPLPVEGEDQVVEGAPPDVRPSPGDEVSFFEELTETRMTPAPLPKAPVQIFVPPLPPITPLEGEPPLPGVLQMPGTATLPPVPPLPEPGAAPAAAPPAAGAGAAATPPAAAAPAAPAQPTPVPTTIVRIYTIRGVSSRGRAGQPSARVTIPLVPLPLPPTAVKTTFTEKSVVVQWAPPSGENKAQALTFNVYRAGPKPESAAKAASPVKPGTPEQTPPPKPEAPLNSAPLSETKFESAGLEIGTEQCFAVRSVEVVQNVAIEGDAAKAECVTPKDIFPPAAPQALSLLLLDGAIELVWDASTEPDLAGYTVLRAEAPGDTLRPLTPTPIRETTFRDTNVRSGAYYTYAIIAVDRAGNASPPSARVEGTAR